MKRYVCVVLLAAMAFAMALTLQACKYSTANISDVMICDELVDDAACETDMTTMPSDSEVIYVSGNINNAPSDTVITITWKYLGGEAGDAQEIDSVTLTTTGENEDFFNSNLTSDTGGWPGGDYEVVISLDSDNSEPISKKFSVENSKRTQGGELVSGLKVCDSIVGDECPSDASSLPPDTPVIYSSGELGDVPAGTEVEIVWRYLGGEAGDEQDLDSVVLTTTETTSNVFSSNLSAPTAGWPAGEYEVVVLVDGVKEASKQFEIE